MKVSPFPFFMSILIFAPLAFASVDPWAMAVVEILIGITAFLFIFQVKRGTENLYRVPGTLPLILLFGWMIIQVIPWPGVMVKYISPAIYQIYQPISGLFQNEMFMPLSVLQKATLAEMLRLGSYFLFYYLTVQVLSRKERLQKIVKVVIWLATVIGFIAILQKLTSPDKIYWFRMVPADAHPFGPWMYHTHFAAFMEMVCPLALALFLYFRPSVNSQESLRIRVVSLFSMPGSTSHFLMGLSLTVIAASVFMSLSRSGIIIVCVASIFFMIQVSSKRTQDIRLISTILFFSVILLLAWFKWDQVSTGLDYATHRTGRVGPDLLSVWQDAIRIFYNFIVTGTGFGTFPHISPNYNSISSNSAYHHTNNDYIELLTDGGLIGFVLLGWFIIAIMFHSWKMIRRRKDHYAILITFGAVTGIVSMLVHSVADFSMHNGAIGLYFFFVCGLLVAGVNMRQHYRTKPTMLHISQASRSRLITIATAFFLCIIVLFHGGSFLAADQYKKFPLIQKDNIFTAEEFETALTVATLACRYDPFEAKYKAELGKLETLQDHPEKALNWFLKASKNDPLAGGYLQQIGLLLSLKNPEDAKKILAEGYARAANPGIVVVPWAQWLLDNNDRQHAIEVLTKGIEYQPSLIAKIIPILQSHSFNQQEIIAVLSHSVQAWIQYGAYMEGNDNITAAEFYRKGALNQLNWEETIKSDYFEQLYTFYTRYQQTDKALMVLRKAVEKLPGNANLHERLGDYYLKEGIKYRAKEEYGRVLVFDPGNDIVMKKLRDLSKGSIQKSIDRQIHSNGRLRPPES